MSSDALRIEHGLDPSMHGLSLERVPLARGHMVSSLFSELPPVGVPFAEVSALLDGAVLLSFGARLPDHHVLRQTGGRLPVEIARALAAALTRAADVSDAARSPTRSPTPCDDPIPAEISRPDRQAL